MRRKTHSCDMTNEELWKKLQKETKKMAKTQEELKAEITKIAAAVDADLAQTEKVLEAVEALTKKIEESGNTDFTAEVDALKAATDKLASDNATVQAAIDKAVPPTTPPVA